MTAMSWFWKPLGDVPASGRLGRVWHRTCKESKHADCNNPSVPCGRRGPGSLDGATMNDMIKGTLLLWGLCALLGILLGSMFKANHTPSATFEDPQMFQCPPCPDVDPVLTFASHTGGPYRYEYLVETTAKQLPRGLYVRLIRRGRGTPYLGPFKSRAVAQLFASTLLWDAWPE